MSGRSAWFTRGSVARYAFSGSPLGCACQIYYQQLRIEYAFEHAGILQTPDRMSMLPGKGVSARQFPRRHFSPRPELLEP